MNTKPEPTAADDSYELEYDFAGTTTQGKVKVSVLGDTETHELWVGSNHVGDYQRNLKQENDEGQTFLLVKENRKSLGSGNLLAGILFGLHRLRAKKKARNPKAVHPPS